MTEKVWFVRIVVSDRIIFLYRAGERIYSEILTPRHLTTDEIRSYAEGILMGKLGVSLQGEQWKTQENRDQVLEVGPLVLPYNSSRSRQGVVAE